VFGWKAVGVERSQPAPAAIWMGSGGSRAAPERIYPQDAGSLRPSKFEGLSCSAPIYLPRLSLSLSWCLQHWPLDNTNHLYEVQRGLVSLQENR
jgi:hypothetical protein